MKKIISNLIVLTFLFALLGITYIYKDDISNYAIKKYIVSSNIKVDSANTYSKGIDYIGFKQTSNFVPKNKEELENVFFTMLDKGWNSFSFYCDSTYTTYIDDIKEMTNDGTFSAINNYVHPYNTYKTMNVSVNDYGVITIGIVKNYSEEEIKAINNKINTIMSEIITNNMSTTDKIKAFHDYIINNTVYDSDEAKLVENNETSNLYSYKAYNVVINGIGLCGGYSDTLAIFLNKIGVNNFKVSTNRHVWNAVYVDNKWTHIDMTWDDPVNTNNSSQLIYDYFMISDEKLKELDQTKHNYNKSYYLELN